MAKLAVEQVFDGSLAQVAIGGAYDPTKINRGPHTGQFNLGNGDTDKFIGPMPLEVLYGGTTAGAASVNFLSFYNLRVIKFSQDKYYIFVISSGATSPNINIFCFMWQLSTNCHTYIGQIVYTAASNIGGGVTGFNVSLENYTTGTVAVSGTAVTGSGTAWNTGLSVGSRIGFGSTDPSQITNWYEISAIGSDTSITLSTSAGTISSGTPYVIQDLMILFTCVQSTVTNSGLFVIKGLQFADFQNPAKTIPAATTVDKIKAVYWIKDAATVTYTSTKGFALGPRDSWNQQYAYVVNGSTNATVYKVNVRAPLTLSGGSAILTGNNMIITGAQSVAINNLTSLSGDMLTDITGDSSFFILAGATTPVIHRISISNINSGSTSFIADTMPLSTNPVGGVNTNTGGGSLCVADSKINNSIINIAVPSINITKYYTTGATMDRRAGCATSSALTPYRDLNLPAYVQLFSSTYAFSYNIDGWMFYVNSSGSVQVINQYLIVYPLAADWEYADANNNRIICPKITFNEKVSKLYRVLVNNVQNLGNSTLGVSTDAFKIMYRTSGIDDNTGEWISIPQNGDLSGVGNVSSIQFSFLFRTAGVMMLPARVLSLAVLYESIDDLPSEYRWNYINTSSINGTISWNQVKVFSTFPSLHTINIYRTDTNALVLTQNSNSTTCGTFEYWNGTTWVAGLGSNAVGTKRRFVPSTSLPSTVKLKAEILI